MLSAAGPLVAATKKLTVLEKPDPDIVLSAIQHALMFLGNTSTNFNLEHKSSGPQLAEPRLEVHNSLAGN